MHRPAVFFLLLLLGLTGACKAGSRARSAADRLGRALNPPPPAPDTVPEFLDYAADLGVNISEMAKLPEGVLWIDLAPGEGDPVAKGDSVAVAFQGWLPDGTMVDSTTATVRIGTGQLIDGLELGVPGMKPGGRRQFVVPPGLAYGSLGRDDIPPNAVLVYQLELKGKVP
jgi:hypothetical protein